MAHPRQQIRDSFRDALEALPVTRYNIYPGRVRALTDSELPAIIITTPRDEETGTVMGGTYERSLTVQLDVTLKAATEGQQNYYDYLDTACIEIEQTLASGISALVTDVSLVETETAYDAELDKPRGLATLTYRVLYRVLAGDFETLAA